MPFTKVQQFVDAEIYGGSDPEVGCPEDPRDRLAVLKEIQNDVAALIQATKEMAVEDGLAYFKAVDYKEYTVKAHTKQRFTWIK